MLKLVSTSDILKVVTTNGTTPDVDYYADYTDFPTTGGGTPSFGTFIGNITTNTTTNIVTAPAASTTRQINYVSFTNDDTTNVELQVTYTNASSTVKITALYVLAPGDSLEYNTNTNWTLILGNGGLTEYDNGNSGTAITINWNNGVNQLVTLTGNVTFTFSNQQNGQTYRLRIIQGAAAYTVAFPGVVKWAGSSTPTFSTVNLREDIAVFYYTASAYYGQAGINFG